jgi:hypothetical protein
MVHTLIEGEEKDVGFADFKEGVQASLEDKPMNDLWDGDKKFGWRMEERRKSAALTPEPGAPAPHTHDVAGTTTT